MNYEIMAPVGSPESLAAALRAGADSIYFGIERLNMRAHSASTFTIDDLRRIARECRTFGVKSYLTVNTIIYDADIALMVSVSSSFATPIGSPTHMLVYGPGGYRFSDFMRIGLLMNLIILAANILIVNIVYPLTPLP